MAKIRSRIAETELEGSEIMRVFETLDGINNAYEIELFNCLPDKAKSIFFLALNNLAFEKNIEVTSIIKYWEEQFFECKSPIEKILLMSFNIVRNIRISEVDDEYPCVSIYPQYEIITENHKYFADFCFVLEGYKEDVVVIVECDGHEFHKKTKEQVEKDNQREYEIKKAGYDVLRFSGTQIYNSPFKCANDIFDYLIIKSKG